MGQTYIILVAIRLLFHTILFFQIHEFQTPYYSGL